MNKRIKDLLIKTLPYIGFVVFFSPLILSIAFSWWFSFLFAISWKPTLWITKYRFKLKAERKREKKAKDFPVSFSRSY